MDGPRIEVRPTVAIDDAEQLAEAYTPGVADACRAIADEPGSAGRLTTRGNSVAVVSDGSAILGLGDLGARAALPLLEGKAALFKRFGGVEAFPLCVTGDGVEAMADAVAAVAEGFGGVNLEDIAAPDCFEMEERLRARLDVPVFHDDQHGTAIVVAAALTNALRVVDKRAADVRVVVSGAGAAGVATAYLLQEAGVGSIAVYDSHGPVHPDRGDLGDVKRRLAEYTDPPGVDVALGDALAGADVFVGLSAPDLIGADDVAGMAGKPVVFALANPEPEIEPGVAREHAAVVATGRSDEPNQINNVLAFPGVFRGLLDAGATRLTTGAQLAAARAIADRVPEDDLAEGTIVPSVFDDGLVPAIARAVRDS